MADGIQAAGTAPPTFRRVKVWDPVVRAFHWTTAIGVIANLTVLREEVGLHTYVGYAVLAALAVRLVWGFAARGHARFGSFVPSPRGLLTYASSLAKRNEPRFIGHNPAGAAMMIVLMLLIAIVGATGWMMSLDRFWGVAWVETTHKTAANVMIGAIALHVIGAIVESVRHRENLPLAMITGYKREASGTDIDYAPPAH